ncbi:MAG: DNA modification methylase [Magnetococcales bacterium]|nr:DNA modification methylase [Magnetococcales bacterium]
MPLQIENWPLDRLTPYARNPRRNDEVVDRMVGAIREFGFRIPIVAKSDGLVVDGHLRLKAARRLGMVEVPVVLADDLTEAQIKAFRLLANQSANWAQWDEDLLKVELEELRALDFNLEMTGFDLSEIDRMLEREGGEEGGGGSCGTEIIPEPPATPVTRAGDLWILGDHRLLCGSSLVAEDVIRLMNGERAVLFATDPPYLVDYNGTNHPPNSARKAKTARGDTGGTNGNKDWSATYGVTWDDSSQGPELYEGFIRNAIDHAIDPHSAWYCWHASKRQAMLESIWEKYGAFVHQQLIWSKTRAVMTRTHYLWGHEPCFFGWIKGNKPPRVSEEYLSTVWHMAGLEGDDRPEHPTPKPLDCFAIPMKQHVQPGGLCYEPFSGSGSQIMAGEKTGRRVFAMEISPVYVDVAVKRFIQTTGRIVYLDGSGGKTFEDAAAERGIDLNS